MPRVLILMAGPKFDLEWEFGCRLSGLSEFSEGYLLVTGAEACVLDIERYRVVATLFKKGGLLVSLRTRLGYIWQCLRTMRAARREGRPIDLVVTYDPLVTGAIGLLLATIFGAKLICEVNGDYLADANFMHVESVRIRALKRELAGRLGRFVLSRADGIRTLFSDQLENFGYSPRPNQVVAQFPEFVNTAAFSNLGEEPTVLLVGFPFYVKGIDVAISAFKLIASDHPDWQLKIIGHYPDAGRLEEAIGGHSQISYMKPVPNREMNEHLGRCGIVLQSSRTEAMGRVLVEAMAAAKPRIASDVGGIPTVVEDGVDGILVESEDVQGFAHALQSLIRAPELRQAMGRAGSQRAATELAPEQYFRSVETLFRAVGAG